MSEEYEEPAEDSPADDDDVISAENDVSDSDDMRSALEAAVQDVEEHDKPEAGTETVAADVTPETEAKADVSAAGIPEEEVPSAERKAPIDWTPADREQWSKVPQSIQEKIIARERDIAASMSNVSEAKRVHDKMSELGRSYAPILAAEGVNDPMEAAEGLFKTVAELRMGSPDQKAQVMANLIQNYGVDIQSLDNKLAGVETNSPHSEFESIIDQKMAPINQVMEQLNQMQNNGQQQQQQQAVQSVQEFGKTAEFINDVRMDMADLIDMAAARGQSVTMQQAYDKACAIHPEISNIIQQRKQADAIKGGNASMASKLNASSSLSGRQSGVGGQRSGGSLRDSLLSAWDEQGD